jgi:ABC-type branched-subunit amino acid transport system ATPase component
MTGSLLSVRGLVAGYGPVPVTHNIDLDVAPGEVVALVGPNGAGKTTTLLTLSGAIPALSGDVRWNGVPARGQLHHRARKGLGYVTEERSVFMRLTTLQNLKVGRGDIRHALSLFPELAERQNVKAGDLSGGEQQMLTLARALSRKPKLLLADELSLGLGPLIVERLLKAVRQAADDDGLGVLLVEQHVDKVMQLADRAYVLNRGEIVLTGPAAEFRGNADRLRAAYLGGPARWPDGSPPPADAEAAAQTGAPGQADEAEYMQPAREPAGPAS